LQALKCAGLAVVGAPISMTCGGQSLASNQSFTLEADEVLQIGGMRHGSRAYLCVVGGFYSPEILGSRSALTPLERGEVLPCAELSVRRRIIYHEFDWPMVPAFSERLREKVRMLRVIPGPEADWFVEAKGVRGQGPGVSEYASALNSDPSPLTTDPLVLFTVRPESNRMGLRLSGEPLRMPSREMVSQPVAPGAVQVTRDGQLILLGIDGQTIGGYPRIAHVISADLDLVGQLRPGDQVSFQYVSLAEAEQLGRDKRALLERWCLRLQEAANAC
jgi:allophanate hydrolase subunit 2